MAHRLRDGTGFVTSAAAARCSSSGRRPLGVYHPFAERGRAGHPERFRETTGNNFQLHTDDLTAAAFIHYLSGEVF